MAFTFTDAHVNEYHQQGYTIFRSLLPVSLLTDLRREADKGREVARKLYGPNAQRIQPVFKYPDDMSIKPFDDFHNLPALVDALNKLFAHAFGGPVDPDGCRETFGILYEPSAGPWCTQWHRDWRDNMPNLKLAEWDKLMLDLRYFNQINCALYDDNCTWVVPGSHLRRDTPGEIRRFPKRPVPGPKLEQDLSPEGVERACLEYTQSMPGAAQANLNAGDYMLYRNSLWHIGNYVPYKRRSTIHDGIFTAEFKAFFTNPPMHPRGENEPPRWENPNTDTPAYAAATRG